MTPAVPRRGAALRRVPAVLVLLIGAVVLLRPLFRAPEDPVVAATPARGAVLATAPPAVELAFGSRPRRGDAHVTVTAAAGQRVDRGATTVQGTGVRETLPPLGEGWYVVAYHVTLADGSEPSGAYAFAVGRPAGPPPPVDAGAAAPAAAEGHAGHAGPPDPLTLVALGANAVVLVVLGARLAWWRRRRRS
ncbi:copper resistance CopC family protein [Micromonospora sp. NPDC023966]|uniref:copper resistance CopC family protein n=1 Tax=Micromonospora sp. NPDC023966 TaxID=3154699 RepID=UPI0033F4B288